MGFDPRRWSAEPRHQTRVTSNVDALLAENESLRRELRQLRRRLELLEQRTVRTAWQEPAAAPPRVSRSQVEHWGEELALQKGWGTLRLAALEALIDTLNRSSFHPQLSLQQRLDRLLPGLGHDLLQAVAGPLTKKRCAVLAAFALYGVSAIEWLDDDPQRVVAELRQRQERASSGRRTRSDQRSSDRRTSDRHSQSYDNTPGAHSPRDPLQLEALRVLGLEWGASKQAIKQAHRRLVKLHHPDLGGSAEAFRRVSEAYQRLVA